MKNILIKNARLVVQMDNKRNKIAGGNIYIENGEIKFVGTGMPEEIKKNNNHLL
mgnify:CR=1 FL=1